MSRLKKLGTIGLVVVFFLGGFVFAGELIRTIKGHSGAVNGVAFSPDGTIIASVSKGDNIIKLWDAQNGTLLNTLKGHSGAVNSVAFSPDGTIIASRSRKIIKLWDVQNGILMRTIQAQKNYKVTSVTFSPDGTMIASGSWGIIKLWNTKNGTLMRTIQQAHKFYVFSVAFSPDGTMIASGGQKDGIIKLWNTKNGTLLRTLKGHKYDISSVVFSPDGSMIASGSKDDTIKLWDTKNGILLRTLKGHKHDVISLAFSPEGSMIASGSKDDTIKLWDTKNGILLRTLKAHKSYVSSVAFSPEGTMIVSGSWDRTIKIWDVSPYNESLANNLYESIDKSNHIALCEFIKKFSTKLDVVQKALQTIKSAVSSEDNFEAIQLMLGISYVPLTVSLSERIAELAKNKREDVYKLITHENTISGYLWFMRTYPKSEDFVNAKKALYSLIKKENSIAAYRRFSNISLINTSKESTEALGEITKLMYTKAKELDSVSSYAVFVQRYPLAKEAVEATERIYSMLFKKAKEKNTVKAYNEFVYACPLAQQVKEANEKAYELEKEKYTDIGILGFVGKDEKMNKQARKLLIEAKNIFDSAKIRMNINIHNAGHHIVIGRMYELVRSEFGETNAALTLQESENIDEFKKRYQEFIYSLTKKDGDWESRIQSRKSIIDQINEVVGDVYADKQLTDFYNNSGKEAFTKSSDLG